MIFFFGEECLRACEKCLNPYVSGTAMVHVFIPFSSAQLSYQWSLFWSPYLKLQLYLLLGRHFLSLGFIFLQSTYLLKYHILKILVFYLPPPTPTTLSRMQFLWGQKYICLVYSPHLELCLKFSKYLISIFWMDDC